MLKEASCPYALSLCRRGVLCIFLESGDSKGARDGRRSIGWGIVGEDVWLAENHRATKILAVGGYF
jgi:hypothetical protein